MIEEWRIIDEFPTYEVSNKGKVRKRENYFLKHMIPVDIGRFL